MEGKKFYLIVLIALVVLLGYLSYQILKTFLVPIAWAIVLGILFYPLYAGVRRFVRWESLASLLVVGIALIAVIGPLTYFSVLLVQEAGDLVEDLRRAGAEIVFGGMMLRIAFVALFMAAGTFLLFKWELPRVGLDEARTIAFCALVAFQWFNALNSRSDQQSFFTLGLFSNRWLLGGIALAVVLQLMIVYVPLFQGLFYTVPLGLDDWAIILLAAGSIFVAEELRKALAPRIFNRGK